MLFPSYGGSQEEATVYGLSMKARCLTAQTGETDRNRFLIGTLGLREENEVHLIEIVEDSEELQWERVGQYPHPKEVWNIAPCPSDPDLFFTCYNTGLEYRASLWRIQGEGDYSELNEVVNLASHNGTVKRVGWKPTVMDAETTSNSVFSLDDNSLKLWDLGSLGSEGEQVVGKEVTTITISGFQTLTTAQWSPHFEEEIATASGTRVQGWDLRSGKESFCIKEANGHSVRDMDYNPNKLYLLVTAGDDASLNFWDIRNTNHPLKAVPAHSHWIWNVEYNRSRDQLLLSSSTDSSVCLWKISSLSSGPLLAAGGDAEPTPSSTGSNNNRYHAKDYLIRSYDDHEHSVYSVAWGSSLASPYVFASLSYDGRVVINQVPEEEIEKIQQET
ncbi:EARP and GARP complex-interacting protein 1 [Balamuthia mandrillaris]